MLVRVDAVAVGFGVAVAFGVGCPRSTALTASLVTSPRVTAASTRRTTARAVANCPTFWPCSTRQRQPSPCPRRC